MINIGAKMIGKTKLTDEDRHAIKTLKGCVPYSVIVQKYGISKSTIYSIQNEEKSKSAKSKAAKNYYARNKEKFMNSVKARRNKMYYGLEDISELGSMQIWESEMGKVLILDSGNGRFNIYDSKGNLRNKWKLINKVCDVKELFKNE